MQDIILRKQVNMDLNKMKTQATNILVMSTGCAINKDMYYMSCSFNNFSQDEPYTRLFFYQHKTKDKWFYHDRPGWRVVSTCYQPASNDKPRTVYALSEEGDIEILNREDTSVEKIKDAGLLSTSKFYGYVNKIRLIDGAFYVCGHQCQVYRKASMDWEHIDQGLIQDNIPPRESQELTLEGLVERYIDQATSLMDINGTNHKNIYTAGTNGFIAHYNGHIWKTFKKLTAADLHSIYIDSNNTAWIVGSQGTLVTGNHMNGFAVITRKELNTDFNAITEFNGNLYIAATDGIYRITDTTIEKEPIPLLNVSSIESIEGVLWALSETALMRFDGHVWETFKHVDT